jgi:hypothetical protein
MCRFAANRIFNRATQELAHAVKEHRTASEVNENQIEERTPSAFWKKQPQPRTEYRKTYR